MTFAKKAVFGRNYLDFMSTIRGFGVACARLAAPGLVAIRGSKPAAGRADDRLRAA
nr:hypothetical protein [Burkholderia ambifaria]